LVSMFSMLERNGEREKLNWVKIYNVNTANSSWFEQNINIFN